MLVPCRDAFGFISLSPVGQQLSPNDFAGPCRRVDRFAVVEGCFLCRSGDIPGFPKYQERCQKEQNCHARDQAYRPPPL